ncbi:MAG: hypothetical protein HN757_10365 [Calditrichaeota bacterium]|jgi:hypothetical protein|nr:hypothetical protein [Calditrichota bacterium]
MITTGHFPTGFMYLERFRTRYSIPEIRDTFGLWVRISGGCFLIDIWVWNYSVLLSSIFTVVGCVALGISFYTDHKQISGK